MSNLAAIAIILCLLFHKRLSCGHFGLEGRSERVARNKKNYFAFWAVVGCTDNFGLMVVKTKFIIYDNARWMNFVFPSSLAACAP